MSWPKSPSPGSIGAPLVNGGGQAGATLVADGFVPGVALQAFSFFSFTAGGRNYLHALTGAVTVNGSGQASLPIGPMLRASPADNAALNFATPQIEGFIDGQSIPWDLDLLVTVGTSFTLFEIE
jgi:hypothetical protein